MLWLSVAAATVNIGISAKLTSNPIAVRFWLPSEIKYMVQDGDGREEKREYFREQQPSQSVVSSHVGMKTRLERVVKSTECGTWSRAQENF